ncbi:MAG: hypothetical protein ACOC8L_00675 [Spirochaetota bacterium]
MAKSVRQEIKGQSDFISDIYVRGMLYATTIRSPFARATIQSIDISELPEGITCVTARYSRKERNEDRWGVDAAPRASRDPFCR